MFPKGARSANACFPKAGLAFIDAEGDGFGEGCSEGFNG